MNSMAAALNSTNSNDEFYNVMLTASALGKTRVYITVGVSGFCAFAFLVFLFARCFLEIYHDDEAQKISRKLLPGSIFIMVIYFGAEFATSVMIILGKCRVIQYYPTLIALDFVGLFADSSLLSFLLVTFAARMYTIAEKDTLTPLLFGIYCAVLGVVASANPPAFLWKGVQGIIGAETAAALNQTGGVRFRILGSYQALNVSFYGLYAGGVAGLAWITFRCMKKFGKRAKTLTVCLWIVVVSLAIRTAGKTLYSILFVLQARTKSPTMVLIHTIFYGLLSVVIYGSVLIMLRSESFNRGLQTREENGVRYARASQGSFHDEEYKPPHQIHVHRSEIVNVPQVPQGARPWRGHAVDYYDYPQQAQLLRPTYPQSARY